MPKSKYSFGLEGKRFNRTVVQFFSHAVPAAHEKRYYWNCLCDCGAQHIADARSMFRGMVQSCGCLSKENLGLRTKHGHTTRQTTTREFTSWRKMRQRVDNPNNEWFHRYGGRGIRYCRGFENFSHFFQLLGIRPDNHSIDRVDNNGHYSCGKCEECQTNGWPFNCRWATPKQQAANRER